MSLHTPSIYVAMVMVYSLLAILQAFIVRLRSGGEVMQFWLAGNLLGLAGHLLLLGRNELPFSLTISLANTCILLGWGATWAGIRRFNRQPANILLVWLPGPLVGLCFQFVDFIGQDESRRIIVFTGVYVFMMGGSLRDCMRAQRNEPLAMRRLLSAVILCVMLFLLVRGGLMASVQSAQGILASNAVSGSLVLLMIAAIILVNMTNILMLQERLENSLLGAARTDFLTGLLNRAGFNEEAERHLRRTRRQSTSSALLLMDIDHFKRVNDSYGHDAGDRLLQLFAQTTRQSLRPMDLLSRHGGEEFCALLTDIDAEIAMLVAERVRASFEAAVLEVGGQPIRATVSLGVAIVAANSNSMETALNRADKALYRAKQQGRNQVQFDAGGIEAPAAKLRDRAADTQPDEPRPEPVRANLSKS